MRKIIDTVLMSLLLAAFPSCQDTPTEVVDDTDGEMNLYSPVGSLKYDGETVLLGIDDSKVKVACDLLFSNQQTSVTDDTKLLIVSSSSGYEAEINKVLEAGGYVATVYPSDDILLHVENAGTYVCNVYSPRVIKDNEEITEDADFVNDGSGENMVDFESFMAEEGYNELYTYLYPWVADLKSHDSAGNSRNNGVSLFGDSSDNPDNDNTFKMFHYQNVKTYTGEKQVRKAAASKPDKIPYNGSVSAVFDIYQLHCFEGQPGSGDYYVVDMTGNVCNQDMYRGCWNNKHGGVRTHICGLYGKSFDIKCTPLKRTVSGTGFTYSEMPNSDIFFTSAGFPSPDGSKNAVSYTSSHVRGVNAGLSITGKAEKKGKGPASVGGQASASVAGNWSWSDSKTYTISDMDIENLSSGNTAGYALKFNNLPYYSHKAKNNHFREGNSVLYRSTASIHASWAWYMPNVKDDSEEEPISILINYKPKYGAMSWYSSRADLNTDEYEIGTDTAHVDLTPFIRARSLPVTVYNNFKENISISKIQIYRLNEENKKVLYWQYTSTLLRGKNVRTAGLDIKNKYRIEFTTTDGRTFVYSKNGNSVLTLQWQDALSNPYGNKVYAQDDFQQE